MTPPLIPTRRVRRLAPVGVVGAALLLGACGQSVDGSGGSAAPADPQATVTVTSCGREVSLPGPAERVVGLAPGATELLVRLGAGERLVGQAQTDLGAPPDDVAAPLADVPVLSTGLPPAREDLLGAEPDLVVSPTGYEFTAEQGFASLDQLGQAGAGAYVATAGCLERRQSGEVEDLFADIEALGTLLGTEDEAADLAAELRGELDAVTERVDGRPAPRVAQVFVDGTTLAVIGAGIEADIILRAGGQPVFAADDPLFADFFSAQITPERLAEADPEVIVFGTGDEEQARATREYLRQTFPQTTAVVEDRLVSYPTAGTFPGSPGNVRAVVTLAEAFHPAP